MDEITVIMPTSPIPSNPDTRVIDETIASIRRQVSSKIVISADGVRSEQREQRGRNYDEYLKRISRSAEEEWENVSVTRMDHWGHQANTTRLAMEHVDTPLILFMEHDTPLCDEPYDWEALVRAALDDRVNLIRFYHEVQIHPEHAYLMLDHHPLDIQGAPLIRTIQWSQRPHIAKTSFYRDILNTYFGKDSRTMIEDVMHGVVWTTWNEEQLSGWDKFRIWLYHPLDTPTIKRSEHLDGREGDPKFDMFFEYNDNVTPWGAPARTAGRVD